MKHLGKVFVGYNIALALFYAYRFLFFDVTISPEKALTLFFLVIISVFVLVHEVQW